MQGTNPSISVRRLLIGSLVILVLFAIIIAQLLNLQVVKGESLAEDSELKKTKTLSLKGNRGSITDSSGLPLAYDQQSYDIQFYREPSVKAKEYTQSIRRAISIVEGNGGETIGGFSIEYIDGEYSFNWNTQSETVAQKRRAQWMSNFYLKDPKDVPLTAEEAYLQLLKIYELEEDIPFEQAYKVLSVWQDWQSKAYLIKPISIAVNVDFRTVAQIEVQMNDLLGISVSESSVRIYPRGTFASHLIGYTGAIDETELEDYRAMGYSPDDIIGVSGIEKSMEMELTGKITSRHGSRTVEVNSRNVVTREISYTAPADGNTVMLNIDANMQQRAQAALANNIDRCRIEAQNRITTAPEEYQARYVNAMKSRDTASLNLANSGAVVVIDVNNGDVLACVSQPGFDPNDFVGGLSQESATKYFDTELSELAKASPMFNRAVATRAMPGSIFKMATGLAGVMEGVITMNESIPDMGYYTKYTKTSATKAPSCWVRNNFWKHQDNNNLFAAVKDSCNYYFFETADRLGIDKLHKWSTALGLTTKTGIELTNEVTPVVGNQQNLYDPERSPYNQRASRTNVVAYSIRNRLIEVGNSRSVNYEEGRIDEVVQELMNLSVELTDFEAEAKSRIREILMTRLGLSSSEVSEKDLSNYFYSLIYDIRWSPNETILTGIGQSITTITPVAAARYVAAIANGGTVYELHLVDKIIDPNGNVIEEKQPVIINQITGADDVLSEIRRGMHGVVDSEGGAAGTANRLFRDYAYMDQIAAKTGTAQVNNIDVENNAWFVAYAPLDKPQIAVAVFIPNGYQGLLAGLTAMDIFTYYFESQEAAAPEEINLPGRWVP